MSLFRIHFTSYRFCFAFTENHLFVVRLSKYSGEKVTQTSDVPEPVYLAISKNIELLQKIQNRQVSLSPCDTVVRGIAYVTEGTNV
jgi:hypothetical protein